LQFRSADQAVRFAYRMRDRAEYARVDLNGSRGRGHGLSPLELHGEAAVILSKIHALPSDERGCIFARHSAELRVEGVRLICRSLSGSVPVPDHALEASVLHWSTSKPSVRQIAKLAGVSYRKAYGWKSEVSRACRQNYDKALNSLESVLFQPGGYDKC
jgi:hypothetical protein